MALRRVSEARPIPFEALSNDERSRIDDANRWVAQLAEHLSAEYPSTDGIELERSGRVLFINGGRGAGKTSFLLTLLSHWADRPGFVDESKPRPRHSPIFLGPVLDFDPLPRDMPIHAWLLEPWRAHIGSGRERVGGGNEFDSIEEEFADLYERVVIGWTQSGAPGRTVVERALAYQEQSSGWAETKQKWRRFVQRCLCRRHGCREGGCRGAHETFFVVAIDDVDLQVEQVPGLLHAIRLLHHPNVIYAVTGDVEHLERVVELDYLGRHRRIAKLEGASDAPGRDDVLGNVLAQALDASRSLAKALCEKAIPTHARMDLGPLDGPALLRLAVSGAGFGARQQKTIAQMLSPAWVEVLKAVGPFAKMRRTQHAIDRHLVPRRLADGALSRLEQVEFIADVCSVLIEVDVDQADGRPLLRVSGALRANLEGGDYVLDGRDGMRIMLRHRFVVGRSELPKAIPEPDPLELIRLMQLAKEHKLVRCNVAWRVVGSLIATRIVWWVGKSSYPLWIEWPWVRTPALAALPVIEADAMAVPPVGSVARELFLVCRWLRANLLAYVPHDSPLPDMLTVGVLSFRELVKRLAVLEESVLPNQHVGEILQHLVLLTAPYLGLSASAAREIRSEVKKRIRLSDFARVHDRWIVGSMSRARSADLTTPTFMSQMKRRFGDDRAWWVLVRLSEFLIVRRTKKLGSVKS